MEQREPGKSDWCPPPEPWLPRCIPTTGFARGRTVRSDIPPQGSRLVTGMRIARGSSSTGTAACAVFAIVVEPVSYVQPTKPHSQPLAEARDKEWLCYSAFAAA